MNNTLNRRDFCKLAGLSSLLFLAENAATAQPPVLPRSSAVQGLIDQATTAHGGEALKNLQTLYEASETRVTGPMGFRLPTRHYDVWVDRETHHSRWQARVSDKPTAVFEQTPEGIFLWTKDLGTQKLKRNDPFLALAPLGGSGVLGLFTLPYTTDTLTIVENGEIQGKKGRMLVRAQPAPVEDVIESGRDGLKRVVSQTTWSYLFAPDGTLIAEHIVETQPDSVADTQLSYDEFQTIAGIKYPKEVGVKSGYAPKGISIHTSITRVIVNAPVERDTFEMPPASTPPPASSSAGQK